MGNWHLGIDLGTTNSAAALFDGERVHLVRSASGGNLTPSVVRIDARGQVSVGARARRLAATDPQNVRAEFKRLMGTTHSLEFAASGQRRSPEQLSALVLQSIREDVKDQVGWPPSQAVISVPALFELPQTRATADAARIAGFEKVDFIQEPVASAIAAGWRAEEADGRPWLVYDLGGGTFDASLLSSAEGMLTVVGHDGDNFLGGRDFDGIVLEMILEQLAAQGIAVDRADPAVQPALRKLRLAAEEAKIELSRAREAGVVLPGLSLPGGTVDVDAVISAPDFQARTLALVDRSLLVCKRLLERHGAGEPGALAHVVMVGGPTVMGWLRERVAEGLAAPLRTNLDPMTLVAQGAALFAGTLGLEARPSSATAPPGPKGPSIWLQHPTMTADLSPWVMGRLPADSPVQAVRLRRADGAWQSEAEPPTAEGAVGFMVELLPRVASQFHVEGQVGGRWGPLTPPMLTIVHGLTLQDPPLSRTLGVALADDRVQIFIERGAPLPMRRSLTLRTVEAVSPGSGHVLQVPLVQGEMPLAHLCRLVGVLEVPASSLKRGLPVGSEVEVALEIDRGGCLTARARLPDGSTFDQVVHLVVPALDPARLSRMVEELGNRVHAVGRAASANFDVQRAAAAGQAQALMAEVRTALPLALAGDLDALERSRRQLLEVDELLAGLEAEGAWPDFAERLRNTRSAAVVWVSRHGTAAERNMLDEATAQLDRAMKARNISECRRLEELLNELRHSAWLRHPNAWPSLFAHVRGRSSEMSDIREAQRLFERGDRQLREDNLAGLEQTVEALWRLLPPDVEKRRRSYGSGLRT